MLAVGAALFATSAGCAIVTPLGLATTKAESLVMGKQSSALPIYISKTDPRTYRNIIIDPPVTALRDKVPADTMKKIYEDLVNRVNSDGDTIYFAYRAEAAPKDPHALRIHIEVLDYEEGSQTLRATTFGGMGYLIVRYTVTDAKTGKTLAIFNGRGFLKDSFMFGGSIDEAIGLANAAVIDYLKGKL